MAPSSHPSPPSQHAAGAEHPALLARVSAHDAFFCRMVDLVSPELYLPQEEAAEPNAKYYKVRWTEGGVVDSAPVSWSSFVL